MLVHQSVSALQNDGLDKLPQFNLRWILYPQGVVYHEAVPGRTSYSERAALLFCCRPT